MNDLIGLYAARFDGDRQLTRWHLIESSIGDRLITRCGREMYRTIAAGRLLVESDPAHPCLVCSRRDAVATPSPERIASAVG